ncbi:hypothetical protein [Tropicibacter sp. Alg240-R139]|uniref:hypothetical protein n=1 Tax=Tropicibacter sp. Alg240-R139 TaxID=2305991 RepID=UPI0013DFF46E|nr:hypothetical protein [Tropicibacter sp. Alg240-R139]
MSVNLCALVDRICMIPVGLDIMSAVLKFAARGKLREILTRFIATLLKGVCSGMLGTKRVQSLSATTVMIVGLSVQCAVG